MVRPTGTQIIDMLHVFCTCYCSESLFIQPVAHSFGSDYCICYTEWVLNCHCDIIWVIADLVLKDKIFVYDLARQRLGWANYDCKLHFYLSGVPGP